MTIPNNITNDKQVELLDALNKYYEQEYGDWYDTLSDTIGEDGLIGIAYTEYYENDDYYEYDTIQVSYDLDTEEYVYICNDKEGKHEKREKASIDYFIDDLKWCDFNDFIRFDKEGN